jgi:cytochrome c556
MARLVSRLVLASVIFASMSITGVYAETAAEKVANERWELMKSLWPKFYSDMARASRSDAPDFSIIITNAPKAVDALKHMATLFPAGSGREGAPDTRAKPEIWTQRAEFDAALQSLITTTSALGDAAKAKDTNAVKAQWQKVAQACGGCHGGPAKSGGKFRFEEN